MTVTDPIAHVPGPDDGRRAADGATSDMTVNRALAVVGPTRPSRRRRWWLLLGAGLLGLAGIGLWPLLKAALQPAPVPAVPRIPVVAAAAQSGDVPIYLIGFGAVQASNTVTIKARIDGTLDKVAFVEGQDVKVGDLLAQIDPRPLQAQLDQVVAARARDQAMLDNARLDLRRDQYLVGLNAATKQLRDTQLGLVAQDAATVTDDQAQIAYATLQLGYTRVTASIAGRTGVRLVDAGNMVHATDTTGLVVLTQIAPVSVLFTLPEDDVGAVNRQLAAGPLGVAASSRAANKVLGWGTVLLVNNQIDQTTGTILLKATFPNLDHALWPGQFVDVQLRIETRHGAVTVPAAAVQRGPQGVFVYVIKADDTAEMRPVTVSTANAGGPMALIESGIAAGERVVIDGQLKLRPGTRVTVTPGSTVTPAGPPPPSGPPPP